MIKNIILCLCSLLILGACSSIQVIATPPAEYIPNRPTTDKELITEWQQSLIKIKEWQTWYDIQVGSNYFYTNKRSK